MDVDGADQGIRPHRQDQGAAVPRGEPCAGGGVPRRAAQRCSRNGDLGRRPSLRVPAGCADRAYREGGRGDPVARPAHLQVERDGTVEPDVSQHRRSLPPVDVPPGSARHGAGAGAVLHRAREHDRRGHVRCVGQRRAEPAAAERGGLHRVEHRPRHHRPHLLRGQAHAEAGVAGHPHRHLRVPQEDGAVRQVPGRGHGGDGAGPQGARPAAQCPERQRYGGGGSSAEHAEPPARIREGLPPDSWPEGDARGCLRQPADAEERHGQGQVGRARRLCRSCRHHRGDA